MSDVTSAVPGLAWLKQNYPDLYTGYSQMIKGLRADLAFDEKTLQLHTLSVLTARQLTRGVGIHVRYAREAGATDEEILSSIAVCFATCGIGPTVEALEAVLPALAALSAAEQQEAGQHDAQ
ncbi:MAG: carboxymuconolactone decarboxylase family protein [Actinomycetota bacterium]|nr:carboxymuconolactone decarboxylase family protein [Actinomycetota bacterium]